MRKRHKRLARKRYQSVDVVQSVHEAGEQLARRDSLILVERGTPRSVWLRCPCGCGESISINVDERIYPSWHLRRNDASITLLPSVWRETGCGAHFILWENEIFMCSSRRDAPLATERSVRRFLDPD